MWVKSSSNEKPLEVQEVSNGRYLLHRNIEEKTRVNEKGETITYWDYEECLVSSMEYNIIEAINQKELKRECVIRDEYTQELIEEGIL